MPTMFKLKVMNGKSYVITKVKLDITSDITMAVN